MVSSKSSGAWLAEDLNNEFSRVSSTKMASNRLLSGSLSASAHRAQVVVLLGPQAGRRFPISRRLLIGRSPLVQIQLTSDDISRRHAEIVLVGEHCELRDLGSRNGVAVNGVPVTVQRLEFGDRIRVGDETLMVFTPFDNVEERLLQMQRLESIGQLAGGIAHDFNNLLSTILASTSYLQGLGAISLSDEDVQECLADVREATEWGAQLTQQLLGFARSGAITGESVDLGSLCQEVVRMVERTFHQSIVVETHFDADLCVMGDRGQLHQLVMNLGINARDAMPKGGTLSLRLFRRVMGPSDTANLHPLREGPHVVLEVRDTGVGMNDETRQKI
ncbi:MAG: FHA domain-containing protein, partial [Deltaproteobacteria bacterium]|nr:FHA domain-containing protein [Deltaproteobacteria bacterium]